MKNDWRAKLKREVKFTAVRSQGPGGQNVNKVSSAAQLTWSPSESELFSPNQIKKILENLKVDKDGVHRIQSQKFRELSANKGACLEKLILRIDEALAPRKVRKKTKPPKSALRRRAEDKKKRSEIKKLRAGVREP